MHHVLSVELLRKSRVNENIWSDLALILVGSIFVALSAQIAFYLPFSPIPITGQTLAVLLCGAVLGSRRGSLSLALYLLQGAIGFPVFAGGTGGLAVFFGPTAGYLAGFVPAAFLVGALCEKGFDRNWASTLIAFLGGQLIIYVLGILRLSSFIGFEQVLEIGIVPFLFGDAIKIGIAAILLPSCWKMINK